MNKNSLDRCFEDYLEKQPFLKTIHSNKAFGRSFSCFATSVILHSVLKKKQVLSDIKCFWTDRSGDGKIDGIAVSVDGIIIHNATQFDVIKSFKKLDFYFVQAKKKKEPIKKEEVEEFLQGLKSFVIDGEVFVNKDGEEKPSPAMQQWKILFDTVKNKCKKLKRWQKPKVFIHLYYATWLPKVHKFAADEHYFKNEVENSFVDKFGCEAYVRFHWADCDYLRKNYVKNKKRNRTDILKRDDNTVLIRWDIGVINQISRDSDGIISSKNYGDVYFTADNASENCGELKSNDEVKFQIVDNSDFMGDGKIQWSVFGKSLERV